MTREEAIQWLKDISWQMGSVKRWQNIEAIDMAIEALSAEAVQGWRTGKPKKQGEYTVTVKSMRGGMVELLYYGKPIMPNCKVKGMCWYRSDDEWGDVVYDDADILAWQPLPTPYKGGDDE